MGFLGNSYVKDNTVGIFGRLNCAKPLLRISKEKMMRFDNNPVKQSRAEALTRIFEDTQDWCRSDPALKQSITASIAGTVFYPAGTIPDLTPPQFPQPMLVSVSRRRTLEAALFHLQREPGANVTVLNFASATNPGGGVTRGSSAQEEALCRCSTLYPTLCTPELRREFYEFHRSLRDMRYTDACIYTPGVVIVKTDVGLPERMDPRDWRRVNVITCAAPNLRERPYNAMNPGQGTAIRLSDAELLSIHKTRGKKILQTAAAHGTDILILGAFGCGAFRNPPSVVARAYRELLDQFDGYLRQVEFAVYCSARDSRNYEAFQAAMR